MTMSKSNDLGNFLLVAWMLWAFDKYKTAQWVESLGLNAPKTYVTLASARAALAKGEIAFPLFMKPRWGSGSIGLETIDDMEELDIYYHLLMKKILREKNKKLSFFRD